jgi:hypothetical protein
MPKAILLSLLLMSATAFAQPPEPLRELDFVTGSWEAVGGPPGSSGSTTFRRDAQEKSAERLTRR